MGNSWEQEVVEGNPSFLRDLGPYAYNLCYKGCKHNCNYCNLIIFLNLVIGISAPAGPVPCNIIKLMNIIIGSIRNDSTNEQNQQIHY